MSIWAIFNDEGFCEELDASNKADAQAELEAGDWSDDKHAHVGEMCDEHHGHEAWSCEECAEDDERVEDES